MGDFMFPFHFFPKAFLRILVRASGKTRDLFNGHVNQQQSRGGILSSTLDLRGDIRGPPGANLR